MAPGRAKTGQPRKKSRGARTPTHSQGNNLSSADKPLKIGEAARLLGVEAYVLRFWETQFPTLRPRQSRSRHRYYGEAELETLKVIKRLLYAEGFTIAGARKLIREKGKDLREPSTMLASARVLTRSDAHSRPNAKINAAIDRLESPEKATQMLREIREELRSLRRLLNGRG
jgi:DNA-binding transcriptional MerR regulator